MIKCFGEDTIHPELTLLAVLFGVNCILTEAFYH